MPKRRRTAAPAKKGPHCKRVARSDGRRQTMCWDAKGKITSQSKVRGYHKRKKG